MIVHRGLLSAARARVGPRRGSWQQRRDTSGVRIGLVAADRRSSPSVRLLLCCAINGCNDGLARRGATIASKAQAVQRTSHRPGFSPRLALELEVKFAVALGGGFGSKNSCLVFRLVRHRRRVDQRFGCRRDAIVRNLHLAAQPSPEGAVRLGQVTWRLGHAKCSAVERGDLRFGRGLGRFFHNEKLLQNARSINTFVERRKLRPIGYAPFPPARCSRPPSLFLQNAPPFSNRGGPTCRRVTSVAWAMVK